MRRDAPASRLRSESRGFSLVELAVAIAVLAGLLHLLLDRVLYMQEMAEKTEVEETIRSINYGLRLEAASRLARGPGERLLLLENDNPVKWLAVPPRNYLGEYSQPPAGAKPAFWYFQPEAKQLIYRPNRSEHLLVKQGRNKEIRFVVRMAKGENRPMLHAQSDYFWFAEKKPQ